jgi:cobalt/nickel transport system permease protein
MLGSLLLRTIDRAQRVHLAMLSRAFTGEIHIVKQYRFGAAEKIYTFGLILVFTFMRLVDIATLLGNFMLEIGS